MKLLKFNNKRLRSIAIKRYLNNIGINKVVCFSCGHASDELKKVGLNVLEVSPAGDLSANVWFNSAKIYNYFGNIFNATSGYLPFDLMIEIGQLFKTNIGELPKVNYIPCGSGETLVCLKLAYPNKDFIAIYDNSNPATKYDKENPLNKLVQLLAKKVIIRT